MKFSLLIAHYNNEVYFKDCLRSIQAQTFTDFEVIIVDDFSTIDSFEEIKRLTQSDLRFKVFRNDENSGVGFTKNRCTQLASSSILAFLDPDDAIYPNAIELMIKEHALKPEVAAVYSKMMLCNNTLGELNPFSRTKKVINNDPFFVNIDTRVAHFFSFKKEAFKKTNGIDSTLRSAVDQDMYLKLYEQGPFYYINQCLYKYRLHEKGVSQNLNKNTAKSDFKKVIYTTMIRRGVKKINGKLIEPMSHEQLYNEHTHLKDNLLYKIKNFIK